MGRTGIWAALLLIQALLEQVTDRVRGKLGSWVPGLEQGHHIPSPVWGEGGAVALHGWGRITLSWQSGGEFLPGLGQRDTHLENHLDSPGSHSAGKLLLWLRIEQGLECSQLKAVLEALQDNCVTCECRSTLPGAAGWVFEVHLEEFVLLLVPKGTSTGGVWCTVWLWQLGLEPHAKMLPCDVLWMCLKWRRED